jgi:predicted PolB exonuclease-like 3'-5' exonuclease
MERDNKLFIDIETIPSDTMPKIEDIKVPGNYSKPDTIAKYQFDNQESLYKKQALDSMQGRIICIGYAYSGIANTIAMEEGETLQLFYFHVKEIFDDIMETPHFVGWNIGTFDLPWLWRKAIQYNLPELRALIPHNNRNLYTDLMKVWACDFKDYVSLDNCASFLGIEHPGGKGSDVYDWWKEGNIDAIRAHCEEDVRTTMKIYERICG